MNQSQENLFLLPPLHGTAALLPPFLNALPPTWSAETYEFAADDKRTYDEWTARIRDALPRQKPFVLIAESYSGPIAVKIAATSPPQLRAVVLAGTFLTNPVKIFPGWLVRMAKPLLRCPVPRFVLRHYVLSPESPVELTQALYRAVDALPAATAADRIVTACRADVRDEYRRLTVPILVLMGRQERLIGPRARAEFTRLRRDVSVVEIESPHLVLEHAPQTSVDTIGQFLSQLPPTTA